MKFTAEIQIIPHPEIADPQSATIAKHLHKLDFQGVRNLRVGKLILLELEAESEVAAHDMVTDACKKLLANPIIESFSFYLQEIEESTPTEAEVSDTEENTDDEQEMAPSEISPEEE